MHCDDWVDTTIGDQVTLQRGIDITKKEQRAGRVPVVSSGGISSYHDTAQASAPGVILGRKGALGTVYFVDEDYWPHDTTLWVRDFHGNDPKFVYYFFKDRARHFLSMDVGSANPTLNRNHVHPIPVPWPPRNQQRAIAHILGTLDDKIELNRRMNETLEAMARAIFNSWFVDFDPVHINQARKGKKATGKKKHVPANGFTWNPDILALFPDSFEDSALGPIPTGWEVAQIRDRASRLQYGLTRSASKEQIGPKFLRITDIVGGRIDWDAVPFCHASETEYEKYRVGGGDILVARTGASTGQNIYLVDAPDAVFASYLVRFQFDDPGIARTVGEFMRSAAYSDYVAGCIGGSAQPNANAQTLASVSVVFPPSEVAGFFLDLVTPLDKTRTVNENQSSTLAAIRDTLLPRLLSGEIRVAEAEKLVEEVA